jgi:hypothetical protein
MGTWIVVTLGRLRSWKEKCHTWNTTCCNSSCIEDVETLLDGEKVQVKNNPRWFEIPTWIVDFKRQE